MARRMFATDIVNSDPFLEMPASSQVLYFHLGLHCDDDGFVYPKKIMRMMNAGDDDLKILLAKKFIIAFESGVVVQKHWRVNNWIRPDRKRNTPHKEEYAQLSQNNAGVYTLVDSRLAVDNRSKEVSKEVNRDSLKNTTGEQNTARSDEGLKRVGDFVRQNLPPSKKT